jgi:predicted small metal-binding protein
MDHGHRGVLFATRRVRIPAGKTENPLLHYFGKKGRCTMAKVLRCKDVGVDCDFEVRAATEEEVLKKAAEHAQTVHNMKEMTKEVVDKVRAAIRDE